MPRIIARCACDIRESRLVDAPGRARQRLRRPDAAARRHAAACRHAPHLVFGTDGRVSGADGCNRLTGPFTEKGDAITFGNLAVTSMACVKTDEIERRFQSVLKGTGHWRIEDGRLKFYGATGKPLAVFERRAVTPPGP